ncbi:hypothetical protein [Synechocystis sp. LKSZ1]|uniref:hypothetical protein n=1 Tax=Synechocystis sp. LKSZ1 TaxID=3144951 RepID=UPI00336BBAFA
MPDFQTFITILTALLVFLLGIFLKYDTLYLRNYQIHFPQWAGLVLAGATFSLVVLDQLLRGFVRLEEIQCRDEEARRKDEEARRREEDAVRAKNERLETAERETRRTRIETRYRIALLQFQLDPSGLHRRQLADLLALLQEYQDTL